MVVAAPVRPALMTGSWRPLTTTSPSWVELSVSFTSIRSFWPTVREMPLRLASWKPTNVTFTV